MAATDSPPVSEALDEALRATAKGATSLAKADVFPSSSLADTAVLHAGWEEWLFAGIVKSTSSFSSLSKIVIA
jgi:hypothetical protein